MICLEEDKMDIIVMKLTPELAEDYIDYFDNRAFSDGNKEKGCYCVWHHWTEKCEYERSLLPESERAYCKRNYARELIQRGKLNGFAAFCGREMVGFCNADRKSSYFRLSGENGLGNAENDKILSIVCFTVAPDMRRRGIAKAMLAGACKYAEENGFDYVEGYPMAGDFIVSDCGGSVSMYVEQGFDITRIDDGVVARKKIN